MSFLFIGNNFSLKYHLSEKIDTREMKLFSSKDKAIDYVCWYHSAAVGMTLIMC
jgi:hypothetical protein